MVTQTLSRSQRRMERRQAILLLALVLAVSIVSFALGVMVGRGRGEAPKAAAVVERMPVALPGSAGGSAPPASTTDLTFYDSLPKGGKPPLGSGINLPQEEIASAPPSPPPVAAAPAVPPPAAAPPARVEEPRTASPPTVQPKPGGAEAPPAVSPPVQAAAPKAAGGGVWMIQAASFPNAQDADKLKQRLSGKGYPVQVQEANLAGKGTWYRVMVGPFTSEGAAAGTAGRLRDQEKLSVMVRKS